MAAPQVSGALALLTEWWRQYSGWGIFSPAIGKAVIINNAVDLNCDEITDTNDCVDNAIPNKNEGWGRINLEQIMEGPKNFLFF